MRKRSSGYLFFVLLKHHDDRMANSVRASGKEAERVSVPEIDIPAPQEMQNTPEGREQKLRKALERLESVQPSDVTELTRSWLEEILDRGALYATIPSSSTAGGRLISPTADFGVVDPHRMMRTDTVRPKGLLDHSYMHGSCGSTSALSAVGHHTGRCAHGPTIQRSAWKAYSANFA